MEETIFIGDGLASIESNWSDGLPSSTVTGRVPEDGGQCIWDIDDYTIHPIIEGTERIITIAPICFFEGECYAPVEVVTYVNKLSLDKPPPDPNNITMENWSVLFDNKVVSVDLKEKCWEYNNNYYCDLFGFNLDGSPDFETDKYFDEDSSYIGGYNREFFKKHKDVFPSFASEIKGAVAYTWTDNGSGNTNWNDQQNWNGGAVGYPDDGVGKNPNTDTATLNSTWTAVCTVNAAITVGEVTLDTGYTGTVTLTNTLTIDDAGGENGDLTVTQGTLDTGADLALSIDGATSVTDTLNLNSSVVDFNGTITILSTGTVNDGATVTCIGIDVQASGTLSIDGSPATGQNAALTWTFDDNAGSGFGASAGTGVLKGDGGNAVTLNSAGAPPTNYWDAGTDMDWTVDYTTFSYYTTFAITGTLDIDDVTFSFNDPTDSYGLFLNDATLTALTDIDFDNISAAAGGGALTWGGSGYAGFDTIVITNMVTGPDVGGNTNGEFYNCSFDITNCDCQANGIVTSRLHNTVAGAFRVAMASGDTVLSDEFITTPETTDDVYLHIETGGAVAPIFRLSVNTTYGSLIVNATTTLDTSGSDYALNVAGAVSVTGTLTENGSTVSTGSVTIGAAGTQTATSATHTYTSDFDNSAGGVFTHSSGMSTFSGAAGTVTGTTTWNNVTCGTSPGDTKFVNDQNIAGDLTIDGGDTATLDGTANTVTLTFTNVGGQPKIEGPGTLRFDTNTVNFCGIYGNATENVLFDTLTTLVVDIDFGGAGSLVRFGYLESDIALATGGGTVAVTQTQICDSDSTLTITANDTWTTSGADYTLDVASHVVVGGTLTGNASTIGMGSCTISGGGTYSATSTVTTITSETAGNYAYDNDGTLNNNSGNFTFTYAGATKIDAVGTAGNFYDVTLNNAALTIQQTTATTVLHHFTITAGTWNTNDGTDWAFTVASRTRIAGTLTCNNSAISIGSGVSSAASMLEVQAGGIFNGGTGAHTIGTILAGTATSTLTMTSGTCIMNGMKNTNQIEVVATATFAHSNGVLNTTLVGGKWLVDAASHSLFNVIINHAGDTHLAADLIISDDLTITAGRFSTDDDGGTAYDLAVAANVDITGILDADVAATSTLSFGSLTIQAAGEYDATAGVTTFTSKTVGGYTYDNDGTLTPNNGTFVFTYAGTAWLDGTGVAGNIYNLILNNAALVLRLTTGFTVDNDMTVTSGTFRTSNVAGGYIMTVTGDLKVTDTFTGQTSPDVYVGSLTIDAAGTYNAPTGQTQAMSVDGGGYSYINNGTYVDAGGVFQFKHAGVMLIAPTGIAGNLVDVSINNAAAVLTLTEDTVFGAMSVSTNGAEFTTSAGNWAFTLNSTAPSKLRVANGTTFTSNSSALNIDCNFDIDAGGTFEAPDGAGSFNWAGTTWTNDGTFNHNLGAIVLDGTNQAINDNNTFNTFTKSVAAADTLTFEQNKTQTFDGNVTLNGAVGQLLSLVSSNPGTAWNFTMTATAAKTNLDFLDVVDSDASGSDAAHKPINPSNSTDGGGNTDWFPGGGGGGAAAVRGSALPFWLE